MTDDERMRYAIELAQAIYEDARHQQWVHDPVAFALYRAWRETELGRLQRKDGNK